MIEAALAIFVAPSPLGLRWSQAAIDAGRYRKLDVSVDAPASQDGVLVTHDPAVFSAQRARSRLIIHTPLADYLHAYRSDGLTQSLLVHSDFLAAADAEARRGATVVAALGNRIQLPLLGDIEISGDVSNFPAASDEERSLCAFEHLPIKAGATAEWPGSIFLYTLGNAFTGGPNPIDLTGRARFLTHGPYIRLSPGVWEGSLDFWFEGDGVVSPRVTFDWGAEDVFTETTVELSQSGNYRITLATEWTKPAPAQFRLSLQIPTFHGRIGLQKLQVTLLEEARAPDVAAFPASA